MAYHTRRAKHLTGTALPKNRKDNARIYMKSNISPCQNRMHNDTQQSNPKWIQNHAEIAAVQQ